MEIAELLLVESDSCVSCVNLGYEVSQIMDQRIEVIRPHNEEEIRRLIEHHSLEKLPALVLSKDNKELGRLYGYQPQFILEVWIEDCLTKEGA